MTARTSPSAQLLLSANLGFLWTELPLPDAVRAAARAGFDAVELHWPYSVPAPELRAAVEETGLPVLGLNMSRGDPDKGEFGLAALPGREADALAAFEQALGYARRIDAGNIHVMAGLAEGDAARRTFVANLRRFRDLAAPYGVTLLLEPINSRDVPGYFLSDCEAAAAIISDCGGDGIRIMYDCYHMQIMRGDLLRQAARMMDLIGHIQFAAVPDRAEPDHGEVDYGWLLPALRDAGYSGCFGAEYKPRATTDDGLGWIGRIAPRG
ncbi:hydroxypyruvate isomerase family protein [Stappia sp. MMSF_3263]|uniref:hydroxypyruvate isomerase family protein n=1 Tax=Stappia sp. MMSF_3263 TaxID=3046693 RepID=UPI00273EB965|nr:TIM barrel protein [Stappia sp. MMSF_3263]